jgi:hypothetical protein
MNSAHASFVQDHMGKGRMLLWIEPQTPQQLAWLCARMVRSSPFVVESCNEA